MILDMPSLKGWCEDRNKYIQMIAETHSFRPEAYAGEWKDLAKKLMIAIVFRGTYKGGL